MYDLRFTIDVNQNSYIVNSRVLLEAKAECTEVHSFNSFCD